MEVYNLFIIHNQKTMPSVGKFYMKFLIPKGNGGFYVQEFNAESFADQENTRNELMSEGWADAEPAEYDAFLDAAPAVGEIAGNSAEWARIESLDEDQKRLVRGAIQGEWKLAQATEAAA